MGIGDRVANHLPYLALLAIIRAHSRTAGRLGVGAAGIHGVVAVALGLHVAAEESVRSDTWRFLGQVDSALSKSFVLLLPSLVLVGVDRGRIAATGLAVAFVVSVVGLAHALWFRDQVPVDATWILVQQLYGVLGSTLLVVVAAAVRIRFEVLCALLVTMIGLSLASTFWITSIGDGDDGQIFSFTIGASLGTAAVIMLWWLLNDREREPDEAPDRPLPLEPVMPNPASSTPLRICSHRT